MKNDEFGIKMTGFGMKNDGFFITNQVLVVAEAADKDQVKGSRHVIAEHQRVPAVRERSINRRHVYTKQRSIKRRHVYTIRGLSLAGVYKQSRQHLHTYPVESNARSNIPATNAPVFIQKFAVFQQNIHHFSSEIHHFSTENSSFFNRKDYANAPPTMSITAPQISVGCGIHQFECKISSF